MIPLLAIIIFMMNFFSSLPLRGALPKESLPPGMACVCVYSEKAPPWGSWLRSRLRGEGFDEEIVNVESCAYHLANFRHSPLTASRSSPGRA